MSDALTTYFAGEKAGGLLLVMFGVASLVLGALAWRSSYRGATVPLVLIALVQLAVGGSIYLRTDRQVAALRSQLTGNAAEYRAAESARMQTVVRSLSVVVIVEVILVIAGVAMALVFQQRATVFAIGLSLIGEGAVMLIFDLLAAQRAKVYEDAIRMLTA